MAENNKSIEELRMKTELKVEELVAGGREAVQAIFPGKKVKLVGYQFHFLAGEEGEEVLSSIGGYASGFKMEDYEE